MRKWRSSDVIQLAKENAELVATALERAQRDKHAGLPSGHGDGRGTTNDGGGAYSRTEMLALSGQIKNDDVRNTLKRLVDLLARTHREASKLVSVPEDERQKLLLPPGAGWCENRACGRWVPGGPDRLRAGRCERCYRYRARRGGDEWQPDPNGDNGERISPG